MVKQWSYKPKSASSILAIPIYKYGIIVRIEDWK